MLKPQYNNVLFANASSLKQLGFLTEELDETRIPLAVKFSQDTKILGVLGQGIYNKILQQINDGVLESRFSILLDNYIVSAIGYLVEAELQIPTSNKLRNKGVVNTTDDKVNSVSLRDINLISNHYNDRAELYLSNLSKYIEQNLNIYPEYYQNDALDKHPDNQPFKIGIYLGNSRNNCKRPENP